MATVTDMGTLIEQTPEICGGRPHIAGTGVSVRRIAGWYQLGLSPQEIATEIPHLSLAQVHAALTYYHANQEAMDAEMSAEEAEHRLYQEHQAGRSQNPAPKGWIDKIAGSFKGDADFEEILGLGREIRRADRVEPEPCP